MKKGKFLNALFVLVTVLSMLMGAWGTSPAHAAGGTVIIGNTPGNNGGYFVLNLFESVRMSFTMTSDVMVESASIKLHCESANFCMSPNVAIYSDVEGQPGNYVTSFGSAGLIPANVDDEYVFSTQAPALLTSGKTYWLQVENADMMGYWLGLITSAPAETPTGEYATYGQTKKSNGTLLDFPPTFRLEGSVSALPDVEITNVDKWYDGQAYGVFFEFDNPNGLATSMQCSLNYVNEGNWFNCDDGAEFPTHGSISSGGLQAGQYTFRVRAVNGDGTSEPVTYSWGFGAEPDTILNEETTTFRGHDAHIEFYSNDQVEGFQCMFIDIGKGSKNEPQWESCSSPLDYYELPAGEYSLRIRAYNGNNEDLTPVKYYIAIAPETYIDENKISVDGQNASLSFYADNSNASFTCRLDNAEGWDYCESPAAYENLSYGDHLFEVYAMLGETQDATPAQFSFTIKQPQQHILNVYADYQSKSKVYGEAEPEFTLSYDGFINGDDASVLTQVPTCKPDQTYTGNAGVYPIVCSGGEDDFYTFEYITEGLVLIVKKSILNVTAENKSKTAGDADPEFTFSYSGFKGEDSANVLDTAPTCSVPVEHTQPGEYAIECSGGSDNNYTMKYFSGTLTVNSPEEHILTVTAESKSKVYGQENPEFTFSYSGFVGNDDASVLTLEPTCKPDQTYTGNVGQYPIVCSGGEDDFYTFAYNSGTLTVEKAQLTVTAGNKSKTAGDADPEFTFSYSGFKGEDNANVLNTAPTCAVAGMHDQAGTYPITCSGGEDNNYSFKYINGTLTVNAAPVLNHAPTNLSLSKDAVEENHPAGTLVGVFSATDPDEGNTFTYTLVNGEGDNDNSAFIIVDDQLKSAQPFNYPTKNSYSIRVRVTDNGDLFFEKALTIHITDTVDIFEDVNNSDWAASWIERLYNSGITNGCSSAPLNFCPDENLTRAQMAVFILKGLHGSSYTPPAVGDDTGFEDVAVDHWAAAWIKQLAAEGITSGCSNGNYCPDEFTTRAEIAVFLLKAKHGGSYAPPAAGTNTGFSDVTVNHWAAAWIKQLAVEGITSGCGNGNYCPESQLTRAEMAVLIVKAFNLP